MVLLVFVDELLWESLIFIKLIHWLHSEWTGKSGMEKISTSGITSILKITAFFNYIHALIKATNSTGTLYLNLLPESECYGLVF